MKAFLLALLVSANAFASPSPAIGRELKKEFLQLHRLVSKMRPEFTVGDYLSGKSYGDHEILWRLGEEAGDPDVIRIYRDKGEKAQALDITFHRSAGIIRGRTVIRRFVGPAMRGWRNDTMDFHSGEYLGSQGTSSPSLDERDREIMEKWGVVLFE